MARPTKTDKEQRAERLTVRYTAAEKIFLEDQARLASLPIAELIRRRSLGLAVQPRPSQADAALISELNRIGVNVNQLARTVHRGRDLPDFWQNLGEELRAVLTRVVRASDHFTGT